MLGGMIVIQTGCRKKRPVVVFRTSARLAYTLRRFGSSRVSFSSCVPVFSSFSAFHNFVLTRPALPSFHGKFVTEEK